MPRSYKSKIILFSLTLLALLSFPVSLFSHNDPNGVTGKHDMTLIVMLRIVLPVLILLVTVAFLVFRSYKGGRRKTKLEKVLVGKFISKDFMTIDSGLSLTKAKAVILEKHVDEIIVVSHPMVYRGIITLSDIEKINAIKIDEITADKLARVDLPKLRMDDNMELALGLFGASGRSWVSVLGKDGSIAGILTRQAVDKVIAGQKG